MSTQSTFTGTGVSAAVGEGEVFYRLSYTAGTGTVAYFFGSDTLTPPRRLLMLLTGTWTGTVVIEFSTDQITWVAVPDESYTANASRYLNG